MHRKMRDNEWTAVEDELLRSLWGNVSATQMAKCDSIAGRSYRAIVNRAERLGLPTIDNSWTRPEKVIVKNNWGILSASGLMSLLPGRTRNAIIGIAHRMGICHGTHDKRRKTVLSPRINIGVIPKPQKQPPSDFKPRRAISLEDIWAPLPGTIPVAIDGLEPWHCRWPLNGRLYCGCPKFGGASYCKIHTDIAVRGFGMVRVTQSSDVGGGAPDAGF